MAVVTKVTRRRKRRGDIPDWWHGVLALQRKVRRAEVALEQARRDRDLAIWLIMDTGAASVRWLAERLGTRSYPWVHQLARQGGEIVAKRGWTRDDVARHLDMMARAKVAAARLAAETEREQWLDSWSAPPPPTGRRRPPASDLLPLPRDRTPPGPLAPGPPAR